MNHYIHIHCPNCGSEGVENTSISPYQHSQAWTCSDCKHVFYLHIRYSEKPALMDPERLLALQRLELDTLLDVIRAVFSLDLEISKIFVIVRNSLQGQLRVRRLCFYYLIDANWQEGMRVGFQPLSETAQVELTSIQSTAYIMQPTHPALFDLGVECIVPIKYRGITKGYFLLSDFVADSEDEINGYLIFIETIGYILYYAIQNKILIRERLKQESVKRELEVAGTIQKQLLRTDFHLFPEIDLYALNISHSEVGGDFYDIIKRGTKSTIVCIADVSGKGMGAALLMSGLHASLRALCAQYQDLTLIVTELNRILFDITKGEKFVTMVLIKIDHEKNKCYYINAGHNYPILLRKGKITELISQCPPLGVLAPSRFKVDTKRFQFSSEDMLCLYTDGLCDQTNLKGDYFELAAIKKELRKAKNLPAKEIVNHFVKVYQDFSQGVTAMDDLTLMMVKFL